MSCAISNTVRARRLRPAGAEGERCKRTSSCRSASLTTMGRTRLAMDSLPENAMAYINLTSYTRPSAGLLARGGHQFPRADAGVMRPGDYTLGYIARPS